MRAHGEILSSGVKERVSRASLLGYTPQVPPPYFLSQNIDSVGVAGVRHEKWRQNIENKGVGGKILETKELSCELLRTPRVFLKCPRTVPVCAIGILSQGWMSQRGKISCELLWKEIAAIVLCKIQFSPSDILQMRRKRIWEI
jgi:hypothetical protein